MFLPSLRYTSKVIRRLLLIKLSFAESEKLADVIKTATDFCVDGQIAPEDRCCNTVVAIQDGPSDDRH
ncbi:Unknown protein sequence [Pseudomonas amygdali pv. lachrymans]|uniref:Uncharacterized protein n=1 Tax=Pseudomonas amygdali pv. lachrymans TaxID=53707 RepID=A0ABR5KS91_PSEAV|nr:Unknown protein sequence [Pseudomonas amygdali pv. lachrymans]